LTTARKCPPWTRFDEGVGAILGEDPPTLAITNTNVDCIVTTA
jgi:hypothetical protein